MLSPRKPSTNRTMTPRILALLFCLYAAVAVPLISLLMPPFQAADELAHAQRSDEISLGGLVATRYGGNLTSGGVVDRNLVRLSQPFDSLRFHPERKVSRTALDSVARLKWGSYDLESFPNTAIYPAFLYAPSALTIVAGRITKVSVLETLILARLANGLVSAAIAGFAIALAGSAAPLLFSILTLPMVLGLFGSLSQDGPMISCAALAAVLLAQSMPSRKALSVASGLIALIAMARPVYIPFTLLPLLLRHIALRTRLLAAGTALTATIGWIFWTSSVTLYRPSAEQVALQLHALSLNPGIVWTLLRTTFTTQVNAGFPYAQQFIGVLGWLDTALPAAYYMTTACVLVLAALLSSSSRRIRSSSEALAAVCLVLGSALLVFIVEYLSWSPVGGSFVEGVQGRYFLPIAVFGILLLPRRKLPLMDWIGLLVGAYPILSMVVTVRAIVFRYYL